MKSKFLIFILSMFMVGITVKANEKSSIIKDVKMVVDGIEGGPVVSKIILEFNKEIKSFYPETENSTITVKTAGEERKVKSTHLSNENGLQVKANSTRFATIELEIETKQNSFAYIGSPFDYNMNIFMNEWKKEYIVEIDAKDFTVDGEVHQFQVKEDLINKKIVPDTALFNYRSSISGKYLNKITIKKII